MSDTVRTLIIIGSGPAGLTAALYAGRAELKPLVIDGSQPGGQLTTTTEVENFPGYPDGVMGPVLVQDIRKQAEKFGAEIISGAVSSVDFSKRPFTVTVGEQVIMANAVIIATGASSRYIGLPNEQRLTGKGVSTCATCDGFFFKDKEIVVVGGGDSAMEESLFLTKFVSKLTIIHRRDAFKASKIMQERVMDNPKITVVWNAEVIDVLGSDHVEGVRIKDTVTGDEKDLATEGMFLAIGHVPNTKVFEGQLTIDHMGYLTLPDPGRSVTNVPGVFAAGDVHDFRYRQAITAAGYGARAAIDAERWLGDEELI